MSTSVHGVVLPRARAIALPRAPKTRAASTSPFDIALRALYALSGATLLFLLLLGSSFYLTPARERAHHDGYWEWKPGGHVGHAMGTVGAAMMLLLLLYSIRKRAKVLRGFGPLRRWLDIHIYLGVFGPSLIVLHSAFKVQGLVALSFWSMIVVALSGIVGRFLYQEIPRSRAGDELSLAEVTAADHRLTERLSQEFGLDETQIGRFQALSPPPPAGSCPFGALADLLLHRSREQASVRRFARSCRTVPASVLREFETVLMKKAALRRRILLWDRLHGLFHYWNVFHKPLALVMYLFMLVHIGVALVSGYGWGGGS